MQNLLSQLLIQEHDVINDCAGIILRKSTLRLTNPTEYENFINSIISFFTEYADEYHHCKEEDILFPEILKKNILAGNGIVLELLEQHGLFRDMIQSMKDAINIKTYENVQLILEAYINSLKDHIAIENAELFPMLDFLFTDKELEKLYYSCIDLDRNLGSARKSGLEILVTKINGINPQGIPNFRD